MGGEGSPHGCRSPLCPALGWSQGLRRTWLWVWLPGYGTAKPNIPGKPVSLEHPRPGPERKGQVSLWLSRRTVLNKLSPANLTDKNVWAAQLREEVWGGSRRLVLRGDGCVCPPDQGQPGS